MWSHKPPIFAALGTTHQYTERLLLWNWVWFMRVPLNETSPPTVKHLGCNIPITPCVYAVCMCWSGVDSVNCQTLIVTNPPICLVETKELSPLEC